MNNQYFLVTLTNLDEFLDLENSDASTIFNNFQFNKYANWICKLAYSIIHKSIAFLNLNEN